MTSLQCLLGWYHWNLRVLPHLCAVGKPTFIVPFFGDQPFWGAACERAGVGPAPVPIDDLTTERIVDALKELILPTWVMVVAM
jgi:hypothetical protein